MKALSCSADKTVPTTVKDDIALYFEFRNIQLLLDHYVFMPLLIRLIGILTFDI